MKKERKASEIFETHDSQIKSKDVLFGLFRCRTKRPLR